MLQGQIIIYLKPLTLGGGLRLKGYVDFSELDMFLLYQWICVKADVLRNVPDCIEGKKSNRATDASHFVINPFFLNNIGTDGKTY